MLGDVQCSDSDTHLVNCRRGTVSSDCDHSDDAGVRCQGMYLYV